MRGEEEKEPCFILTYICSSTNSKHTYLNADKDYGDEDNN